MQLIRSQKRDDCSLKDLVLQVATNKAELVKELQRIGWLLPSRPDGKSIHQRKINKKPNYYYIFVSLKNCSKASEASEADEAGEAGEAGEAHPLNPCS